MKLLFIGNSHSLYNSMPEMVQGLFAALGQKSHVTLLAGSGLSLAAHATSSVTSFNIRLGAYDAVIAQDKAAGFDVQGFRQGASSLKALADKAGTAFYLFMPWVARDARATQAAMTDVYQDFCRSQHCFFAPTGETFGRMLLTESPDALYREDGKYPTPFGSYVAAVTIFYTVTGRKRILRVSDIDDPGVKLGFPPELCQKVHTEACRTVRLYNG